MHAMNVINGVFEERGVLEQGFCEGYNEVLAAEIHPDKRDFLKRQFQMQMLIHDVKDMPSLSRVYNDITKKLDFIPSAEIAGGGFSCTDLTKQSSKRSENKGIVRAEGGKSGTTFKPIKDYIIAKRPFISYLENVPELKQTYWVYENKTSDMEYVTECFEEHGFTVITYDMDASRYGSPKDLERVWFLIIDLPQWKAKAMHIKENIQEYLDWFKMAPIGVENYLMTQDMLEDWTKALPHGLQREPPRRDTDMANWKCTHEEVCTLHNIAWPVDVTDLKEVRIREAEVAKISASIFPEPAEINKFEWLDTNHTLERTLNYPPPPKGSIHNPWRVQVPTNTAQTSVVGRKVNFKGDMSFRYLHPLEGFRLQGWDLPFWRQCPFDRSFPRQDRDLLQSLVGNGWSLHHFGPLFMATLASIDWSNVPADPAPQGFSTGRYLNKKLSQICQSLSSLMNHYASGSAEAYGFFTPKIENPETLKQFGILHASDQHGEIENIQTLNLYALLSDASVDYSELLHQTCF